jgi:ParD-like antitoxin of type II bacterial toxin-antitoxin system
MSHAVDLPDDLVADARAVSESSARSVSAQIEHWARLGRTVDTLLHPASPNRRESANGETLAERIAAVETPAGRQRLAEYLKTRPFPHYEPVPGKPGCFVRISADGDRMVGRFVERRFEAAD